MTFRRRPPLGAALAAALAVLAGCNSFGDPIEAIGGRRPAPDEFKVLPRKPLVVPATVAQPGVQPGPLPTPEPGKPSPLDPNPQREAEVALMGREDAGPWPTTTTSLSAGEAALLSAADVAAGGSDIRVQLETDRQAAADAKENEPYEPPTLLELFGFGDDEEDEIDPAVALDAITESQRLQREGLPAPNDPLATAATEGGNEIFETGAPPKNPDIYYESLDRRPANPLTGNNPPAFD